MSISKLYFEDELKKINSNETKPLNEGGVKILKSVQRGVTSGAGNITINAVDMSKTVVISVSKGSDGYVAARGSVTGTISFSGEHSLFTDGNSGNGTYAREQYGFSGTSSGTRTLSGGSTDLTTKQYSARLNSPTQLYCDGAVEWQVVEFY